MIARAAYDDHLCGEALNLVLDAYGAELGNAAVKWLPFGGLYVCGGIAVKNRERLKERVFLEAYKDRGRLRPVLDRVPLRLVLVDDLGLRGAHYVALATLLGGGVVHTTKEEPPAAPRSRLPTASRRRWTGWPASISRAAAVVSIGLLAAALVDAAALVYNCVPRSDPRIYVFIYNPGRVGDGGSKEDRGGVLRRLSAPGAR